MYFTQDTEEKRNGEPVYTGEDNNVRSLATSGPAAFETMRGPVNRHRIGHLLSNIAAWFFQCWTPRIPNMYGVRTRQTSQSTVDFQHDGTVIGWSIDLASDFTHFHCVEDTFTKND